MGKKRKVSSFSVIVSFIAIAMLGYALMPLLPVKLAPDESLPAVSVSYTMPGSPARTVEQEVTSVLEGVLSRVRGVKHIRSFSEAGKGHITLQLDRNTDMEAARFETSMIVRQASGSLPIGVTYPQVSLQKVDNRSGGPFMSYTVNADAAPSEIMHYCEQRVKPALSRIEGVGEVELSGAMPMEWIIEYDNHMTRELGISRPMIEEALSRHFGTEYLGMADLTDNSENCRIRVAVVGNDSSGKIVSPAKIVVARKGRNIITLDKIASVIHREAAPSGYFRINGLNSIYVSITSEKTANQPEVSAKVREAISRLNIPPGYSFDISYDSSEQITEELDKIYFRTGLTVLILLLFVGIVTLNLRYLLLIAIGLAVNMGVAFAFYYLIGIEIQLYSLAGITISLNLVIDNLIVMTGHITRRHNLRAFPAVLAATLTTIGALSAVFFLDERTMLSLRDFVMVVIVNLTVSLAVALLMVPALADKMQVRQRRFRKLRAATLPQIFARAYSAAAGLACRHRVITVSVFVLTFGTPVFMLPDRLDGEGKWVDFYNKTIGSDFYNDTMRKWVDYGLGGTLRLFVEKVYRGSYFSRDTEPVVYINANLPNGATLEQMNALMTNMERFLSTKDGIRRFRTSIYGPRRGSIEVYFKKEHRHTGYPYRLKAEAVAEALTLGGGSWGIYGLEDQGFSNDVRESAGSYAVKVAGYNYDRLYKIAEEIRDSLLTHKRIKEVTINSERSYWKDDYTEFYINLNKEKLGKDSLSVSDVLSTISHDLGHDNIVGSLTTHEGTENIRLMSRDRRRDVWSVMNFPLTVGKRVFKLSDYAELESRQTPPDIVREDREYVLYLQYEYIGSNLQGNKVLNRFLERLNPRLPLGYRAERENYGYHAFGEGATSYLLLGLIAVIIFFVSAIQFNSLRQPLAIIFVMPVSFIGVFLTFYLFGLKFDNGGFATFILLCGITVNAAIYIIDEYNSLRNRMPTVPTRKLYMKAVKTKITAVLLTVLSTVLGFTPFLIGDTKEGFWFPLAAGTMGGLIISLAAIFFLLPVFVLPRRAFTRQ